MDGNMVDGMRTVEVTMVGGKMHYHIEAKGIHVSKDILSVQIFDAGKTAYTHYLLHNVLCYTVWDNEGIVKNKEVK